MFKVFSFGFYKFQQVNALEITPDRFSLAAAGYQYIRLFDLRNNTPNSVVTYEGVLKNVTGVGFQVTTFSN